MYQTECVTFLVVSGDAGIADHLFKVYWFIDTEKLLTDVNELMHCGNMRGLWKQPEDMTPTDTYTPTCTLLLHRGLFDAAFHRDPPERKSTEAR